MNAMTTGRSRTLFQSFTFKNGFITYDTMYEKRKEKTYRSDCIFASSTAAFSLSLVAFTAKSDEASGDSLPADGVTELGVTFWQGVVTVCKGMTACDCVTSDVNIDFEDESN